MTRSDPDHHEEPSEDTIRSQRWRLIRDLVIFTTKASLEAMRDIALIPAAVIAVIAGLAGMLLSPSKPDRYFQRVLELGDEFDEFIDLFGKEKRRISGSRFDPLDEAESPKRVPAYLRVDHDRRRLRREHVRAAHPHPHAERGPDVEREPAVTAHPHSFDTALSFGQCRKSSRMPGRSGIVLAET